MKRNVGLPGKVLLSGGTFADQRDICSVEERLLIRGTFADQRQSMLIIITFAHLRNRRLLIRGTFARERNVSSQEIRLLWTCNQNKIPITKTFDCRACHFNKHFLFKIRFLLFNACAYFMLYDQWIERFQSNAYFHFKSYFQWIEHFQSKDPVNFWIITNPGNISCSSTWTWICISKQRNSVTECSRTETSSSPGSAEFFPAFPTRDSFVTEC